MNNMNFPQIQIGKRKVGANYPPLVIAEIGINHGGSMSKARKMIDDAVRAGAECVKFQSHVIEDEMTPHAKKVIPGNSKESIWDIMSRCALSEREERELKKYTENKGLIFLSTPFSRAAADRLERIGVSAYKIGSGECNNYPLVEHIASFRKPIILSTGMNDIPAIKMSVAILRKYKTHYALTHCTSIYPTPYDKVRLGALDKLKKEFPDAVLGLSDHSLGVYTCLGSIPYGASILEKHFTSSKKWSGPDIPISVDPAELREMIVGSQAIWQALGGEKNILKEEKPTIDFAYASVVAVKDIRKGELFGENNIWVKRPGTGEIKAVHFTKIIGTKASLDIKKDTQVKWSHIAQRK